MTLSLRIADALSLPHHKVGAALALFEDGATIPFVARYRKEKTGELDEVQLRAISEQHRVLVELDARRDSILDTLREQGQLTADLAIALAACTKKSALEDLYQPYKKRRKTRADTAREQGLQPLADRILAQPSSGNPRSDAARFRGALSTDQALQGARDIVAEHLGNDPELRAAIRRTVGQHGLVRAKAKKGVDSSAFRDYVDYQEPASRIPSHRYLAVCRGEAQGVLSVKVRPDVDRTVAQVLRMIRYYPRSPYGPELQLAAEDATKRLLLPAGERAVRAVLKSESDDEAMGVFAKNLEAVLLAAPLGSAPVLGIDPGIRTGCKCAMVSATGALVDYQTLFLVGRGDKDVAGLVGLLRKHRPAAVAVGNGTGGREAEARVREAVKQVDAAIQVVSVNESGASVYSASELAGRELPDVDLTVRGAVSIARRLQDPLAELVKVDPKSIGVGQYQH
ncbi:MAG: RNA-binding transcriptional accessory protein, partial [Proteobacteria bacterium]|nr:RNA-binding transcriptional accessory protein [Pseudomonadota bacterium]